MANEKIKLTSEEAVELLRGYFEKGYRLNSNNPHHRSIISPSGYSFLQDFNGVSYRGRLVSPKNDYDENSNEENPELKKFFDEVDIASKMFRYANYLNRDQFFDMCEESRRIAFRKNSEKNLEKLVIH